MNTLEEVGVLQTEYELLKNKKGLTKKAICDLVIPFRDKYNLSDKDALMIARNEISILDIAVLLKK